MKREAIIATLQLAGCKPQLIPPGLLAYAILYNGAMYQVDWVLGHGDRWVRVNRIGLDHAWYQCSTDELKAFLTEVLGHDYT